MIPYFLSDAFTQIEIIYQYKIKYQNVNKLRLDKTQSGSASDQDLRSRYWTSNDA